MSITFRTTLFAVTAAILTIASAFLFGMPANAATSVQLPGENLRAPVQDNATASNNGEGHDPDDIEELKEHWKKPEYLADQHRQLTGIAIFCGGVAGFGLIARKRAVAR